MLVRGKQHLLTAPAIALLFAAPLLLLGFAAPWWQVAMLLFLPALFCQWMNVAPAYSAIQGLVPPSSRATASATVLLLQNFIGLGLGSPLIGHLSDVFKADLGTDSVRYVLAGICSLVTLAAGVTFWTARRYLPEELDRHATEAPALA